MTAFVAFCRLDAAIQLNYLRDCLCSANLEQCNL